VPGIFRETKHQLVYQWSNGSGKLMGLGFLLQLLAFVWVWVAENDGWASIYYLPTHPF
jgi:hypothetical protein